MGQRGEAWVAIQAILLLIYALAPQTEAVWAGSTAVWVIGWVLVLTGLFLFVWSLINLGRMLTPLPRPLPEGKLVTAGAYSLVRHPIYSAVILSAVGIALVTESWLRLAMSMLLFIFFDMKARVEERWLVEKYPEYPAYKVRVKKLIPWIY